MSRDFLLGFAGTCVRRAPRLAFLCHFPQKPVDPLHSRSCSCHERVYVVILAPFMHDILTFPKFSVGLRTRSTSQSISTGHFMKRLYSLAPESTLSRPHATPQILHSHQAYGSRIGARSNTISRWQYCRGLFFFSLPDAVPSTLLPFSGIAHKAKHHLKTGSPFVGWETRPPRFV